MATIPTGTKFQGIPTTNDDLNRRSAQSNATAPVYTISDIRASVEPAIQTTGTEISFTKTEIYNTSSAPATGNITNDLTGAQLGIVQKIYHNDGTGPTVPAGWVLIGSGTYTTSALNLIFAEWAGGTRVEYWIVST